MLQLPFRLSAIFLSLTLLFTGQAAPSPERACDGEESSSAVSEAAPSEPLPDIFPAPIPEPSPSRSPEPTPVLTQADIDLALRQVMEKYSAVGVSVATVEHGQVSKSGAWGWAVKGQREMTPDTKVRIASISKVVIGMCAMAMSEDGLIDLDAPISTYWGAKAVNPYSKRQPTARDFMTHTSSLKDLDITRGLSTLRGILNRPSSWRSVEPGNGTYWSYNNFGMCILGTTLELASGQVLDDYLRARLLEPVGARASLHGGRLDAGEVASLYTAGGGLSRSAASHTGQSVPNQIGQGASYFPGGYTTSAVDMAKLTAVLANDGVYKCPLSEYIEISPAEGWEGADGTLPDVSGYRELRLLSPESVADMETPRFTVPLADYSSFEQCLILRRQENILGCDSLYYHTGSAYGVFSLMSYDPATQNGVVVITTGANRSLNERGLYDLCAELSELLYCKMEAEPA